MGRAWPGGARGGRTLGAEEADTQAGHAGVDDAVEDAGRGLPCSGCHRRPSRSDGTLVALREAPPADLVPSLLTLSDVMGTGRFAAEAANVKPGMTVVVVGDGAVGLLGVLSRRASAGWLDGCAAMRLGYGMADHEERPGLVSNPRPVFTVGAHTIVLERVKERWIATVDGRPLDASFETQADAWAAGVREAYRSDGHLA